MTPSVQKSMYDDAVKTLHEAPIDTAKWGTNVMKLLEQLSIYHIELEHQVEAFRETQEQLIRARDEADDLFMNAPLAYVTLNLNFDVTRFNLPFERKFLNQKLPWTVPFRFSQLIVPRCLDAFSRFSRLLSATDTSAQTELGMFDRSGKEVPVKINAISNLVRSSVRFAISDMSLHRAMEARIKEIRSKPQSTMAR